MGTFRSLRRPAIITADYHEHDNQSPWVKRMHETKSLYFLLIFSSPQPGNSGRRIIGVQRWSHLPQLKIYWLTLPLTQLETDGGGGGGGENGRGRQGDARKLMATVSFSWMGRRLLNTSQRTCPVHLVNKRTIFTEPHESNSNPAPSASMLTPDITDIPTSEPNYRLSNKTHRPRQMGQGLFFLMCW